jgi:hypothetical protein
MKVMSLLLAAAGLKVEGPGGKILLELGAVLTRKASESCTPVEYDRLRRSSTQQLRTLSNRH